MILITGPSGSGRTTAINAFEDLGYEVIDSLPLSFVERLIAEPALRPLALGLAPAGRDYTTAGLLELIDRLQERQDIDLHILYLFTDRDILVNRFSETRRRHPMAPEEGPRIGITRELDLLGPIQDIADSVVDTTETTVHELKALIGHNFSLTSESSVSLSLHSFSYKRGIPRGLDMVFDVRFLNNPYWMADLREMTGKDGQVADYIKTDLRFDVFFSKLNELMDILLPAYSEEGKAYLSIGFGCTGGRHRSVFIAEHLAEILKDNGRRVTIRHRELERTVRYDLSRDSVLEGSS